MKCCNCAHGGFLGKLYVSGYCTNGESLSFASLISRDKEGCESYRIKPEYEEILNKIWTHEACNLAQLSQFLEESGIENYV